MVFYLRNDDAVGFEMDHPEINNKWFTLTKSYTAHDMNYGVY
jgi:hypothetical protein